MRLAPELGLPVVLRIDVEFPAEMGPPIATRTGLHNELRIAVEVAA